MAKYLDYDGLLYFWQKLKTALAGKVNVESGKGLSTNDYTTTEKNKLAGIASGAEVNQNAFSNVKVGSTTIAADGKTDTLELAAGSNVTLTPDATNDKVTIAATDTTYGTLTQALVDAGTETTGKLITAKIVKDSIDKKEGFKTTLYGGDSSIDVTDLDSSGNIGLTHSNGTLKISLLCYGYSSTAAGTAEKVVSGITGFVLETGVVIAVKFTVTNTAANPTLKVGSTAAKPIYYRGSAISAGSLAANRTYFFAYNGTQYDLIGDLDTNTTYTPAATAPLMDGTAAVGTSTKYAREDHVHPTDTSRASAEDLSDIEDVLRATHVDGMPIYDGESSDFVHFSTCSTAAATVAKTVDMADFTLVTGAWIAVKFTVTNTGAVASLTLNVNSTGAKPIKYRGANLSAAGQLAANRIYLFVYDGTNWEIVGDLDTNTDTKNTTGSSNTNSKIFLVGATSQATNPQTYSHDTVYVGTDGHLYSDSKQVVNLSGSQALTNKTYNGYTLAAACAKAVDTLIASGSTSTNVPTSAAVEARISAAISAAQVGAAMFQGTVNAGTDISSLTNYKSGWYWVVATAGTYAGQTCEVGDMVFCVSDYATAYSASDFSVVQNNILTIANSEIDTIVAS